MTDNWIPYSTQSIEDEDIAAVVSALRSGWLTTGPSVDRFEQALSDRVGAESTALSSGTAALHAAYFAAGVGPGTVLITTPLTFVATAATAVHLGAEVRFADVEDSTLNIDPDAVATLCTSDTRVVTAVDYAGHPAALEPLLKTTSLVGALLVEDASHSLGGRYDNRPVGSVADLTTFSFHPVKSITTGEGGAVATVDSALSEKVRRFRNHGLVRNPSAHRIHGQGSWHQEVHHLGLNYRMPDIAAALGVSQLKRLEQFVQRRANLAERYTKLLDGIDGIELPIERADVRHAWHLYPIRIKDGRRREVFDTLRSRGIGVQVHYLPIHLHPYFSDLGYQRGMCPVAESAYEELISIPLFPDLTEDMQDRVVTELDAALAT